MRRRVLLVGGVALVTAAAGIVVAASASAGTMTYEAEAAGNSMRGGAHAVECGRCSGGRRVTGIGLLGSLTFAGVVTERAGPTRLAVTYTGAETRTARVSVNGAVAAAIRFPASRGANRPATVRITATLAAGDNTISFGNPDGVAPDVDKLVVTTDGTPPTVAPTASVPNGPGSTATPPPPPGSGPPPGNPAFEAEVLSLVNRERTSAGCPAVTSDDRLVAAARAHSADMATRNYFSHTTPDGVPFATRITRAGYRWSGAGENIAQAQRTPAAVMASWMNSSGHKANILNCDFTNLGVGVAADADGTLFWTQDFARPL
ncbi:CAP domain-containing protein [Jidongwangia harbinensis]|uniref:CAP domain-containing protein n=1 Tax=Jidongwangia harbinensis TaxID=2878561 RepID=UPI001CDA1EAC|nr:CAP domain-containing protein [Jidongwangia harbinensis]MCA2216733.1 CAP domain-containing protein [Jidongwangia harbinensis]